MENKAKIDPKRFGIIKAYQKGERIPDITAKFTDGSKNIKQAESAEKQESQPKKRRRFTRRL